MTPFRLAAIVAIYVIASLAWFVLGTSVTARSGEFDNRLSEEVALLWGGRQTQAAPEIWFERPTTVVDNVERTDASGQVVTESTRRVHIERVPLVAEASEVDVSLALDHRQKGLLWYDTYAVRVAARYRARNPDVEPRPIFVQVLFPSDQVQFDNFVFRINGQEAARAEDPSKGAVAHAVVPPGEAAVIELAYDSRGMDTWSYAFAPTGVADVRNFVLTVRTDFDRIDFPAGTMSPSTRERTDGGWELTWRFESLLTGQRIGMDLPNRPNPGPLAARITFFAPVSLLFFLTVMVILGVLRTESLHPMNYAFLSAAFFAFHLLLAYLVDHLSIHLSFAIASAVSVFLVVTYLRVVAGPHVALGHAGLAQVLFLVLFSYAFFFEGYTGLTVTVGAVVTLFVLMQVTARVDWGRVFSGDAVRPT
jgi:hypothetical protein